MNRTTDPKLSEQAKKRWANWSPEKRQQIREKIRAGYARYRRAQILIRDLFNVECSATQARRRLLSNKQ